VGQRNQALEGGSWEWSGRVMDGLPTWAQRYWNVSMLMSRASRGQLGAHVIIEKRGKLRGLQSAVTLCG
jgi:hypothetical protein